MFFSNKIDVEKAYIITLKGNEVSERYSEQCQTSCIIVNQPYQVWDAYNGIFNPIVAPEHSKDSDYMNLLKVTNHHLTRGEVACCLSHISLWLHCAKIDQPIIVLEHDAYMLKKFTTMNYYNSLVYLGGAEWAEWGWPMKHIPPHGTDGPNIHFMLRAHAYAVDPAMAKNLLSHVLHMGIYTSADCMLRADLFNITHQGLYAYDKHFPDDRHDTTIYNRSGEQIEKNKLKIPRERNDNLSY